ncbi:unnamed protein product [Paramecium octaurelia]|uniref:Uncharacterized protein n=1 Tax=Paramecium octaurelia TaxID=43137 RepID=A0A8S1VXH3_PAROT|nr:unnamed protein product [Paramecium octaurelia]
MTKLNIFIFILLCLGKTQVQWETIYQSFQDINSMDSQGWIVSNNQNGNLTSICNGFSLFGGFNLFGNTTIVSKHFSLPTHYQLKITFEFWKIDSWDNEFVYIFVDDALWKKHYYWNEGIQLCGDQRTIASWYEVKEPITITMNHTSESLIFIMTTNLDEYADGESFGFRDFQLSIVRCPQGCLYCSDSDQSTCNYWVGVLSLWHESILLDGWMKNDIIQPATYRCESFDLVGGQLNLAPGDYVKKNIENLSPHYKIQVNLQLWKIDSWINENFYLFVDNSVVAQAVLGSGGAYSICGSNGLEQIYNIGVTLSHSSSKFQLTMTTSKVSGTTNSYWGIRALNIYLSKCYNSCNLCVGPYRTDCTVCSGGLVLYKSLCTNSPFFLLSKILINQIQDPKSDERIPMEINLLEVNQKIATQGTFTYSINNSLQILTIQVYAKCFTNIKMQSYLIKCLQCQSQNEQEFFHYCYPTINTIVYTARFQVSEQEWIINTSNTECSIYQVAQIDNQAVQIKLLEIIQRNA